jgi:rubredoxin
MRTQSRLINIDHRRFAGYNPVMRREVVWIDQSRFRGWGCSQCAWIFNPTGPPTGETFDAMMRNFESQRDKEFASHVCSNHLRRPKPTPGTT